MNFKVSTCLLCVLILKCTLRYYIRLDEIMMVSRERDWKRKIVVVSDEDIRKGKIRNFHAVTVPDCYTIFTTRSH